MKKIRIEYITRDCQKVFWEVWEGEDLEFYSLSTFSIKERAEHFHAIWAKEVVVSINCQNHGYAHVKGFTEHKSFRDCVLEGQYIS